MKQLNIYRIFIAVGFSMLLAFAPLRTFAQSENDEDDEWTKIVYLEAMDYDRTIDPYTYTGTNETNRRLSSLLYSSLFCINRYSEIVPDMAEKIEAHRAMRNTYIITLKSGLRWKNDDPVTGKDVKFTVEILKSQNTKCQSNLVLQDEIRENIINCTYNEATPQTVQITVAPALKDTSALMRALMFPIIHYKAGMEYLDKKSNYTIGSGPYYFLTKTDQIFMEKNPQYHRKPERSSITQISKLILRSESDDNARYTIFMGEGNENNDGAQLLVDVPWHKILDIAGQSDRYQTIAFAPLNYYYLGLNFDRDIFKIPEFRKALSLAIDRKRVRSDTYLNQCDSATGPFPNASNYWNWKVPQDPYDATQAKTLLRSLKDKGITDNDGNGMFEFKGNPIKLRLLFPLESGSLYKSYENVCNIISGSFRNIGIEVMLEHYPNAQWRDSVYRKRSFDMAFGKWIFGDIYANPAEMFVTGGKYNYIKYSNTEVDSLFSQFQKEVNSDKRKDTGKAIHKKIANERPYIFLWTLKQVSAYDVRRLSNVGINPYNYFDNIYEWGVVKK